MELDIGTFQFYPNLVISEMKEGVVVNFDKCLPLFIHGLEHYKHEKRLIYISNRINSYSIDPTLHLEAKSIYRNLYGYGVVVYDEMNYRIAQLEENFMNCPVNIFYSLDDAKAWAQHLIEME